MVGTAPGMGQADDGGDIVPCDAPLVEVVVVAPRPSIVQVAAALGLGFLGGYLVGGSR